MTNTFEEYPVATCYIECLRAMMLSDRQYASLTMTSSSVENGDGAPSNFMAASLGVSCSEF